MNHLSRPALQDLLLERMKHNKAKTFSMRTLHIFYHYIMNEQERHKLHRLTNDPFEDRIYEILAQPNSWLSMRHDKDGSEIFYLTVYICPIDSGKIKRLLCGLWYDGHCSKHH